MKTILTLILISFVATSCAISQREPESASSASVVDPDYKVVLLSEVEWEQLNPARGENSPKAATLWGDRTGPGPSGFLLRPVDGFKSPPHIHTANYHGVVIKGSIHNADPEADEVYLPPGSFWTQPGSGVHITAAKGSALAYIEVEDTFDVLPAKDASANLVEPVVIQASDIDWTDQPGLEVPSDQAKVVELWSDPDNDRLSGALLKLSAGSTRIPMDDNGTTLHAVVIQGKPKLEMHNETNGKTLEPGSYFGSEGDSPHEISCVGDEDCIIYIRREFKFSADPE